MITIQRQHSQVSDILVEGYGSILALKGWVTSAKIQIHPASFIQLDLQVTCKDEDFEQTCSDLAKMDEQLDKLFIDLMYVCTSDKQQYDSATDTKEIIQHA